MLKKKRCTLLVLIRDQITWCYKPFCRVTPGDSCPYILQWYTNPLISLVDFETFHTDSGKTNTGYYCLSGKCDMTF